MVTDSNSNFSVDVPPGEYTIVQRNHPNLIDVSDSDSGDPNMINVESGNSTDYTFVDEPPSGAPSASGPPTVPTEPSAAPSLSSTPSSSPSVVPLGLISGNQGDMDNADTGNVNLENIAIKFLGSSGVATTETDANGNYVY